MNTHSLPQPGRLFLTDGGLETDFIFNRGIDLPCFASIMLLRDAQGRHQLEAYFRRYLEIARGTGAGFILESATWRASPDWAAPLGLALAELEHLNLAAIEMLKALRAEYQTETMPIFVSGCHGPRGDGYDPERIMSIGEARDYHAWQAEILARAGADMLSGLTMTNVNEAIGVARAARDVGLPAVISFTVETDGRLPTGDMLGDAIEAVDAATDGYPAYFMINCAHPSHFETSLAEGSGWTRRIRGLRVNASRCSHAELDAMTVLDDGDPAELGREHRALRAQLPWIDVLGGCCGTDHRHVAAIAQACLETA
ncbi:MAG: homocysteine S-methyltransferase family protein [Sphingomonas sp.]|nr:homocysteine S-methyltransferase family protein [Sphingomonas sp.]